MSQRARDGDATMPWMVSMSQGAKDGCVMNASDLYVESYERNLSETITRRDAGVSPMDGFTRVSERFQFITRC